MVIIPCDVGVLCSVPVVIPRSDNILGLVKKNMKKKSSVVTGCPSDQ